MKKILDVLDPRKSRSRMINLNSAIAENDKIYVTGVENTFSTTQLTQALKTAATGAAKTKAPVSVRGVVNCLWLWVKSLEFYE